MQPIVPGLLSPLRISKMERPYIVLAVASSLLSLSDNRSRNIRNALERSTSRVPYGFPPSLIRQAKVEHSLEASLDRQALTAVSTWKFNPATKDGQPVAVKINIDVSFKLFR